VPRLPLVRVFRFNCLFPCVLVDAHGKKSVEQVNPTFTTCTSPSRVGFVVAAAGGAFADCPANSNQASVGGFNLVLKLVVDCCSAIALCV
jgi:hypothetical protein